MESWKEQKNKLIFEVKFHSFKDAMRFVNAVAVVAEENAHHPTIYIAYNKVKLELFTFDRHNTITELDYNLQKAIDNILPSYIKPV